MDKSQMKISNIVIIDDDKFSLSTMNLLLKEIGIKNIIEFDEPTEAIKYITEYKNKIDIIFCDLQMPNIDGIQMIRLLSSIKYSGNIIPFSSEKLTFLRKTVELAKNLNLNVSGFMKKPVTIALLKKLIHRYEGKVISSNLYKNSGLEFSKEDMKEALEKKQFELYYQPQIFSKNNNIYGFESLGRWAHPHKGIISPFSYISLLERYNLIDDYTFMMFEKLVNQLLIWQSKGYTLELSINLSPHSLKNNKLPEILESIANKYNILNQNITIEITETSYISLAEQEVLARLYLKGFPLSLDDFGTGYASMEALKNCIYDEIKIDRTFVNGASKDKSMQYILNSIITLANRLQLKIIAEGVETTDDVNYAIKSGCHILQGYYYSKPMNVSDCDAWLKKHYSSTT